ncbi:MAG: integrase core domain-containing protein [Anaerolineae bacterium]|nr:integrase core domain-containing protein [Anaerolineae bacterium]
MDRAPNVNIFMACGAYHIERFWRSLKVEDSYLRDYATEPDLEAGLQRHSAFCNDERPHQSLNYTVPGEVHQSMVTLVC